MKIVMPGGSGHVGRTLQRHLQAQGHETIVLSRRPSLAGDVAWDGKTLGSDWWKTIEGADAVINLAGRSVNCRYTPENLRAILDSRIESTHAVGRAIAKAANPPRVWLNASTATIYAHTFGPPNDDVTGELGGGEPDVPRYWAYSVQVAESWERTLFEPTLPATRRVAMRSAMVMGTEPGSVFTVFVRLARRGLLGRLGSGKQFVSWVHEHDFCRAVEFLITNDLDGPVNIAAPNPLPMEEFAREIRRALGVKFGVPASDWMLKVGTAIVGSDVELVLKSRRVVSRRITDAGFVYEYEEWRDAVRELAGRV